jgi:hypothetical protein
MTSAASTLSPDLKVLSTTLPAGLEILDSDSVEGLALAGLDELVLDNNAGVAIDQDLEP